MKLRTVTATMAALACLAFGPAYAEPVNINEADVDELAEQLTGVGESRARAIVEYREANGPFRSVEELANVAGIGMHIVELNRDSIEVGSAPRK